MQEQKKNAQWLNDPTGKNIQHEITSRRNWKEIDSREDVYTKNNLQRTFFRWNFFVVVSFYIFKKFSQYSHQNSKRNPEWSEFTTESWMVITGLFSEGLFEKETWTLTIQDSILNSDDHFEPHLLGNGLYLSKGARVEKIPQKSFENAETTCRMTPHK